MLTTDVMVEGVHWDDRLSPEDVGYKIVAVNASDVAASGARPTWMLLTLGVHGRDADDWVVRFARGLADAAVAYDVDLVGGDTTSLPPDAPRLVSVAMAGTPTSAGPLRRSGGQPGDLLLVTGVPGLAGAGYLLEAPAPAALHALRRPESRVPFVLEIAPLVHAAMDLSDGLAADLPRLCRACGCGAVVDPSALPDHPALHGAPVDARTLRLAAGDDYELLLAVPPEHLDAVQARAHALDVPLTAIGQLLAEAPGALLTDGNWPSAPWQHFSAGSS